MGPDYQNNFEALIIWWVPIKQSDTIGRVEVPYPSRVRVPTTFMMLRAMPINRPAFDRLVS